jgi:transcriptional regulator, propionate catabolism operon regulatory protein
MPRLPRIAVFSYTGLSRLIKLVAHNFSDKAEITVYDLVLQQAVEKAREIEEKGLADVFVSAGANAEYIRSDLKIPVVEIKVTSHDVMMALIKAKQISEKIGVVSFKNTIHELDDIKDLLKLDITQRTYGTIEDSRHCFHRLANDGIEVIVGSSLVVDLANENGLQGILVYSEETVSNALNHAIELGRLSILEGSRYEQVNSILYNLKDAIIAVDEDGLVTAINPSMCEVINKSEKDCIGKYVDDIVPEIAISEILKNKKNKEEVIQIKGKTLVAKSVPIIENDIFFGVVTVLQDDSSIKKTESTLRTQLKKNSLTAKYLFENINGNSEAFNAIKKTAQRYSKTDSTVLITGESGTGKELFAQAIHNASSRKDSPFVAINCASLPEPLLESELFGYEEGAFTGSKKGGKIGLFESAHRGTIFLDEIGDMPSALQTRLLRVIQEKEVVRLGSSMPIPVDVRLISATHNNLLEEIKKVNFRDDLYYRLNILHIKLPSLRERKEDIPFLALQFLFHSLRKLGSSIPADEALAQISNLLIEYQWPGNVRELENIMERYAVFLSQYSKTSEIDLSILKIEFPEIYAARVSNDKIDQLNIEKNDDYLMTMMSQSKKSKSALAKELGVSRTTLWRILKEKNNL